MKFVELKKMAEKYVQPRQLSEDCHVASVAAALLSKNGNLFFGVCIDTGCSMGFCAEHSAIAQMILNNESEIDKIIAVGSDGKIYPPCGRCREFMYQVNHNNLEAEVLVRENTVVKLSELLPFRLD